MHCPKLCCSALAGALLLLNADASLAAAPGITIDRELGAGRLIDATSLHWGVRLEELSSNRGYKTTYDDISWTQNVDETVPLLLASQLTKVNPTGQYDVVAPGRTDRLPYLSLTTSKNRMQLMNIVGDRVDAAAIYNEFTLTYDPRGRGLSGPARSTSFNRLTNTFDGPRSSTATLFTGTQPAALRGGETSIYLRLGDGGSAIAGESSAVGYENWIKLDSVQMGPIITVSPQVWVDPKTSVNALRWTQAVDASLPVILSNLFVGSVVPAATIEFVKDAGAGPLTFMQLVLDDVRFMELDLTVGDESIANMKGSLAYEAFRLTVWDILPGGLRGRSTSTGFDLTTANAADGPLPPTMPDFGRGNLAPAISGGGSAPTQPIPEPSTWVLMLGGVAMLAGAARRKARRA